MENTILSIIKLAISDNHCNYNERMRYLNLASRGLPIYTYSLLLKQFDYALEYGIDALVIRYPELLQA